MAALSVTVTATPSSGVDPLKVRLVAVASGGSGTYPSFAWSYGNGGTGSGASTYCTYGRAGKFTAQCTVTDSSGATAKASVTITVSPSSPTITVSAAATPSSGTAPLTVDFSASATGGSGTYTWSWDFDDGSEPSMAQNPVHTYAAAGPYVASVTVKDSSGDSAKASIDVTVSAPPAPLSIVATASPGLPAVGQPMSIVAQAAGGNTPYAGFVYASLPPGVVPSSTDPTKAEGSPTTAGTYIASVTVTDAKGVMASADVVVVVGTSVMFENIASVGLSG